MYTSIILNIFSLRKIHGLPMSLVHLEMQVIIRYTRMDRITISLMTRGNRIFKTTSVTFIFDRGKNRIQNKKTVPGYRYLNLQHKLIYSQIQQLTLSVSNSKMLSMLTYAEVTKHKSSSDRKFSEKKIGHCSIEPPDKVSVGVSWLTYISLIRICKLTSIIRNNVSHSYLLPAMTVISTKLKEQTSELLSQAQIVQTLNQTAIGKPPNNQFSINSSNPILRTDRISNYSNESSTVMEEGSQSGGFTQKLYLQYEPEDQ